MDDYIERIKEVIKSLGISRRQFAIQIGFNYNTLNTYLSGRRDSIDVSLFNCIIRSFEQINSRWLITGEGEMFYESENILRDESVKYGKSAAEVDVIKQQKELIEQQREIIKILQQQIKINNQGLNDNPDAQEGGAVGCADASGW